MEIAKFEKVSKKQFEADLEKLLKITDDCYESIEIPKRATKGSAGYDFCSPVEITIKQGEFVGIPTGIRCRIDDGFVLEIYPRSSFGFKYQMTLANTTGIIDADYYGADNEGHIIIGIVNRGEKEFTIKKGERFAQGLFLQFFTAEEEEITAKRVGGFGSTK